VNDFIEIIFVTLVGWAAGAFVSYISDVLPLRRRIVAPFCKFCESRIPLFNYFLWPRRCVSCGKYRAWRVWVVEIVYILLSLWIWRSPPDILGFWLGLLVMVYFGIVVIIDLEYRLIMHPVSLAGVVLGFYVGVVRNGMLETLLGGLIGFGIMWLLYMLGAVILGWISRRRGQETDEVALGFGDVNLSGVLGLMLGWPGIFVGLLVAILLGGIISFIYMIVMVILRRYHLFTALPYGPFLIAGAILIIFFRENVITILGG
jgi:leader peptidase (prepilin peptidase) / N-methyltransferase